MFTEIYNINIPISYLLNTIRTFLKTNASFSRDEKKKFCFTAVSDFSPYSECIILHT